MVPECERVFSAAKKIMPSEKNALGPKVIEACECLRRWWRTGMVLGRSPAYPPTPKVEIEAKVVTTYSPAMHIVKAYGSLQNAAVAILYLQV